MSRHPVVPSFRTLLAVCGILSLVLGAHLAEAQTWARTYDNTSGIGPSQGEARTIRQTSDGGFFFFDVVGGWSSGFDFRLTKLDPMGSVEWSSQYRNYSLYPDPGEALQTADGGYLLSGSIIHKTTPSDPCVSRNLGLIKVSSSGTIEWQRSYGLEVYHIPGGGCQDNGEHGRALAEAGDGNYLVLGYRSTAPLAGLPPGQASQSSDIWLLKVDPDGNILWQKSFGAADQDRTDNPNLLAVMDNGDIVISGITYSYGSSGRGYVLVVRLDPSGTILWERAIGTSVDTTYPMSLAAAGDEVLVVMGTTDFDPTPGGIFNIWLVKLSNTGAVEWQRILYSSPLGIAARRAQQTADGGFILYGDYGQFPDGAPVLLKVTSAGALDWALKYGIGGLGQSGEMTSDGGYIVGGFSKPLYDVLLLRTDEHGVINLDYCDIAEVLPVTSIAISEPLIVTALTTTVTTSPQWDENLTRVMGVEVEDAVCSPPPEPMIHVASNPLYFGNVPLGSTSTLAQQVANIGSADLFISGVSFPSGPEMTLASDGCSGFIISPGASCPLQLNFAPTAEDSFSDQLSVTSDDPNTPSLTVVLQGFGGPSGIFADNFEIGSPSGWSDAVP